MKVLHARWPPAPGCGGGALGQEAALQGLAPPWVSSSRALTLPSLRRSPGLDTEPQSEEVSLALSKSGYSFRILSPEYAKDSLNLASIFPSSLLPVRRFCK